jgi:hypothetical protein
MLKPVWKAYAAEDKLCWRIFPGAHDFPRESKRGALALLRENLSI